MPNDAYTIQTPHGTLTTAMQSKLASALAKVGVPKGGWRFVVLPDQAWKDLKSSSPLPHPTDTTFSNLPGKVTYIHQKALQGSDDDFTRLMAHEYGHRVLNTTSEDKANSYAQDVMKQIRQYGESDAAALQDTQARINADRGAIQPSQAPIKMQLQPTPTPIQRMIDNENAKQQSKLFWDTRAPQSVQQFQSPSTLPFDVVNHLQA